MGPATTPRELNVADPFCCPLAGMGVISLIACRVAQRDADFLRNAAERFGKGNVFDQHHELKSVATDAATEAVRQWVYKPTLLNGNPVEVVTVVDINFTLER